MTPENANASEPSGTPASAALERRRQYRTVYFDSEQGNEQEDSIQFKYPYRQIYADGGMQIVQNRRDDPVMATVKVSGQTYRLRQLDRHIVFRDLYSPPSGEMRFLPNITADEFAATFQRRAPGRCILHYASDDYHECMIAFYLFFDIDGTGFALQYNQRETPKGAIEILETERVDFRWDGSERASEILSAPVEDLREELDRLFEEHINHHLSIPLVDFDELPRIPLTWQNGSEDELRSLTQAICLTEPELFDAEEPIVVVYRAAIENRRGGFVRVERGSRWDGDHYTTRRLMTLCDLAFRLNPFTGTDWFDRSAYEYRRKLQKSALRVHVEIQPGSAHEKAEAYLTLLDWLDDKLHKPEKRERFGLPPTEKT